MVSAEIRELVSSRAGSRCEYCRMHQSLQGATFHVEHIVPRSTGGRDDASNLAWACPSCNLHKSDRTEVALGDSSDVVRLFNPRTDDWPDHFEWDEYSLLGTTEVGRVTIEVLDLNQARRLKIRQPEQRFAVGDRRPRCGAVTVTEGEQSEARAARDKVSVTSGAERRLGEKGHDEPYSC